MDGNSSKITKKSHLCDNIMVPFLTYYLEPMWKIQECDSLAGNHDVYVYTQASNRCADYTAKIRHENIALPKF